MFGIKYEVERALAQMIDRSKSYQETTERLELIAKIAGAMGLLIGVVMGLIVG